MLKIFFNKHFSFSFAYIPYIQSKQIEIFKDDIQTLVLGSSHGYYGFHAQETEFNLCCPSQDLYYSYELYKKNASLKNMKNVILFYSVFSSGFEVEKTSERERCAYYKAFFQIPYKSLEPDIFKTERKNAVKYIDKKLKRFIKKQNIVLDGCRGNPICWPTTQDEDINKRVSSHLKHNQRNNGQDLFVKSIVDLARQYNHNLYIVIAPVHSEMKTLLPSYDVLFSSLHQMIKQFPSIKLLTYWSSIEFCGLDFNDFDHLNPVGCDKLSKLIRRDIKVER